MYFFLERPSKIKLDIKNNKHINEVIMSAFEATSYLKQPYILVHNFDNFLRAFIMTTIFLFYFFINYVLTAFIMLYRMLIT